MRKSNKIEIQVYWKWRKARVVIGEKPPYRYMDFPIYDEIKTPEEAFENLTVALIQAGKVKAGDKILKINVPLDEGKIQ